MDPHTLALIGIVDTLKYVLENETGAANRKELKAAARRLETSRQQLLTEGLRYNQMVGATRDSVLDIARQLRGYLAEKRGMEWILSGLQSASIRDVEPPPPPSSSSIGPKDLAPEVVRLAYALVDIASTRAKTSLSSGANSPVPFASSPSKATKNGSRTRK